MSTELKGLIFSGGGIRGFAYIGCLRALEEKNLITEHMNFFAGCSSGAIIACLIACGYNSHELYDFILHFEYQDIRDLNFLGFLENWGIETGNKIREFIRLLVKKKIRGDQSSNDPTFLDLYHSTGNHLVVNATCINTHEVVYFDYQEYPNMPISLAIRMSISIPFIFAPVKYNGQLYVDGGLMDNFPVHLWKNAEEVLGFKLSVAEKGETVDTFLSFAKNTWYSLYGELNKVKLDAFKEYRYLTLNIDCVNAFNLVATKEMRIHMFNQGYEKCNEYLENYLNEKMTLDTISLDCEPMVDSIIMP